MIIILIAVISLLFLICSLKSKVKNLSVPILPGAWPIIGHIPLFMGDNIKLFERIKQISKAAIENGGCICVPLGIADFYFFTDPDDSYTILNSSIEKHYVYDFTKAWLGEGIFTADPHKWHVNKKLLYPMFQQQNLNKFMTVFNKQGRRLVKQFSEHVGKGAFNHEPYVLHSSLETICQTAMGSNEGAETARNQKFLDALKVVRQTVLKRFKRIWLHFKPLYNNSAVKREITKHVKILNEFTSNLLKQRKAYLKPGSKLDGDNTEAFVPFVDTLIRVSKDNKNFHDQQVKDEVNTLILSGYDTITNTVVFALMLLGHHPDFQDKVYEELNDVFGNTDRDVDKYDITKLIYLEAFIKEVLRLYTTGTLVARNTNTDIKLKNYIVPAGTSCFISLYGIHRNPEWGPDVDVFNPDRWMNPETMPKNPNLFVPFGMGKRNCIGKTYAMMSMKTTLSYVVRNYRIKADISNLVFQMMILLKPASGHHLILEPRN